MNRYSFHTFMFPFRWKIADLEDRPFSEQIDLNSICYAQSPNWERITSPVIDKESDDLYNERNYFYEFVHPVLYDDGSDTTLIRHYERREPKHGELCNVTYHITCGNDKKEYVLDVSSININLYSTGVGVLSVYMYNTRYPEFGDILAINQYGRRVFPPFINDVNIRTELAHKLEFEGLNGVYGEDFSHYTNMAKNNTPASFITKMVREVAGNIEMQPVVDDRMFVLCWCKNDKLTKSFETDYDDFIKNNEDWYKLVFVDKYDSLSCKNVAMRRELIKKATYERWQENCSLYGVSRYSMVFLTNSGTEIYASFLFPYFETEYVRMAELVLMQRATVLRFSSEVTRISKLAARKGFGERVSSLYKEYIHFVNQIYFREISAQDQAIEMYQKLYSAVNVQEQVEKLDKEIEELYNFVSLRADRRTNRTMSRLSWITTIFLPITVVAGYFSMNNFKDNPSFGLETLVMVCFFVIVISIVLLINKNR